MPNLTQTSLPIIQTNQVLSGTSSASNSQSRLENKPKENFNKLYKNELANNAKKTTETKGEAAKNISSQNKIDKSGKTQPSDETQGLKARSLEDEDDHLAVETLTPTNASSLLDLVDHIAALTQQVIGPSDSDATTHDDKELALTSVGQSALPTVSATDNTHTSAGFDATQVIPLDQSTAGAKLIDTDTDIAARTNLSESTPVSSAHQAPPLLPNSAIAKTETKAEMDQRTIELVDGQMQQLRTPISPAAPELPLQEVKSPPPLLEVNDSTDQAKSPATETTEAAMPIMLAVQKNTVNRENSPTDNPLSNTVTTPLASTQAPITASTISVSKTVPTPLHSAENNVSDKFGAMPANASRNTQFSVENRTSDVIYRTPPEQNQLTSNEAIQVPETIDSKETAIKEWTNRIGVKASDYSEKTQNNSSTTFTTKEWALPPMLGTNPITPININGMGNTPNITATQMQDYISPRVGSKGWDNALGQKMIWMVAGEESSVQLSLNPPDLGPLQIVLSVNDNQIDASFVSAHLDVREAIEAASPKLKEMMENAGISLTGFSVSAQAQSSDNSFAQAQQGNVQSKHAAKTELGSVGALKLNQSTRTTSGGKGLVDTFV